MKDNKGFTLIELLAVIIILGILALITVPIVSNYISNTRTDTYQAHEKTMKEAARSLTVECINGKETCDLPREGQSNDIFLSELIDKSFTQRLQNPQGSGYCNESLSYVRVTNTGNSSYDYQACLYCGAYATDSDGCAKMDTDGDTTPPTCGAVEGVSSEWSKEPRTISVGCNDTGSGCARNRFTRTFRTTTVSSNIEISDRAGNTTNCPVSVNIDTNAPTCQLEKYDYEEEVNGWDSGPVKVRFVSGSRQDGESGINTYGLGTSIENVDYNRKEHIDLTHINGVITVIGYVKDNAGNEGTCSINLRVGIQRPDFDIYYGYQIFPLKERYTTSGLNVTANTSIVTKSTDPKLTFTSQSKYKNVTRVVIVGNSAFYNPQDFRLKLDSGSEIAPSVAKSTRVEFNVTKGSYGTYEFKFGSTNDKTYDINRIEIQHTDTSVRTSKPITVNLHPDLSREKVKTSEFSFNNGTNFQSEYFKLFSSTSSGVAQTKNDVPMYSDKKNYSLTVTTTKPGSLSLTQTPTGWTNNDVTLTGKSKDTTSGIIEYGFTKSSALTYFQNGWNAITLTKDEISKTHTVSTIGTYYFNVKNEAALTDSTSIEVNNIDKIAPVCSITNNSTVTCTDSGDTDNAVSSIDKYVYAIGATTSSSFTTVTATSSLSTDVTVGTAGTWTLLAKDRAGNYSSPVSYTYYTITYNKNGGTSCTASSRIVRDGTAVDLTPTCTKSGYSFAGWMDQSAYVNSTTVLSSKTVSSADATIYAKYCQNCASVSHGSCTLTTPSGVCKYTTSCDSGYRYKSGKNTRSPECIPNCRSGYTLTSTGKCRKEYDATGTPTAYSGGCTWKGDSGHYSSSGNCQPAGTVSAANLGDCDASNSGATKNGYSCGAGMYAHLCGGSYQCAQYTNCTAANANTSVSEYKIYTCTCSGTPTSYSYSCPNGGTVSGTKCVIEYDPEA